MNEKLISRSTICSEKSFSDVKISPNGKYLSFLRMEEDKKTICILCVDSLKELTMICGYGNKNINFYSWTYNNNYIIYTLEEKLNNNTTLYLHNISTNEVKAINDDNVCAKIISMSYRYPDKILLGEKRNCKCVYDLYTYDFIKNEKCLLFENQNYSNFVVDEYLELVAAIRPKTRGGYDIINLTKNKKQFLTSISSEDSLNTYPIFYNYKEKSLYIRDSRYRNTSAITRLNFITGESDEIISFNECDIDEILCSRKENCIQAVSKNHVYKNWIIIDSSMKESMDFLKENFDGTIGIISRSLEEDIWIISVEKDILPKTYFIYFKDSKKIKLLFPSKESNYSNQYLKMHSTIIKSKDCYDLICYYTEPKDIKKPYPTVVLVHGGPWHRDVWGFNSKHQWLANRGYFVLSINFRGSTGLGKEFINLSIKEWGRKMHDDIMDGINWAINEGYIDETKLAIMGSSYGGYEALVALMRHSKVFTCAICKSGLFDLVKTVKNIPKYWPYQVALYKKYLGDIDNKEDFENLEKYSPINNIDKIKKPVLILHGENDKRSDPSIAKEFVKKLYEVNPNIMYYMFKNEGHGTNNSKNKIFELASIERFLQIYLGGKYEPYEIETT